MTDKDSRFQEDVQDAPTPRTGLRASNTLETLRPKNIEPSYPLQGRGLPPIDYSVRELSPPPQIPGAVWDALKESQDAAEMASGANNFVRKTDLSTGNGRPEKADIPLLPHPIDEAFALADANEKVGNVLPVDWPTVEETMGWEDTLAVVSSKGLRARIEKLEERVDGILDRLAAHNVRSAHKI